MPSCFPPLFSRFRPTEDSITPLTTPAPAPSPPRSCPTDRHSEKSSPSPHLYVTPCCDLLINAASASAPPSYSPKAHSKLAGEEALEDKIDALNKELRELSLDIHDHPEVGWKEFRTHDVLCKFMEEHGFEVTRHAYGLETAWEATFEHGKGGRIVGFNSEMDALPGIGHGCGHNLIAIAGVAAALAVAAGLKKNDVAGKVVLLGTPAEEKDGGKINLLKAGAYKGMAACQMLHPASFNALGSCLAIAECIVDYTGHTAHAAGAPWEAINAQDAAVLAYNNISALRQQLDPTFRVHGIISGNEDWVQNVIPGSSRIIFACRSPTLKQLEALKVRVENCFKAAALATGCKAKYEWPMTYYDLRNNTILGDGYESYMKEKYDMIIPHENSLGGSTDFGNVSYEVPSLHPAFRIPVGPGEGNHTIGFTNAAATKEAHQLTLEAAKGVAVNAWKVLVDDEFAERVMKEFEEMKKAV